jgi:hypothetical protein
MVSREMVAAMEVVISMSTRHNKNREKTERRGVPTWVTWCGDGSKVGSTPVAPKGWAMDKARTWCTLELPPPSCS